MSQNVRTLKKLLDDFNRTPESRGLELRLDLAQMVLRQLSIKGWTQRDLAHEIGMKESYISRIVHSNANCNLDTVGKILSALGVRATIKDVSTVELSWQLPEASFGFVPMYLDPERRETSHGATYFHQGKATTREESFELAHASACA